jgi:hypothetical protein
VIGDLELQVRRARFDVRRVLARRRIVRELDELITGRRKYPDPREQVDAPAGGPR